MKGKKGRKRRVEKEEKEEGVRENTNSFPVSAPEYSEPQCKC